MLLELHLISNSNLAHPPSQALLASCSYPSIPSLPFLAHLNSHTLLALTVNIQLVCFIALAPECDSTRFF
jgi:hypothetical protein